MASGPWVVIAPTVVRIVCVTVLVLSSAGAARAQAPPTRTSPPLDEVFQRMYELDFAAADRLLDARAQADPTDPLSYSLRAVADTFAEFNRLRILETAFFVDDKKVTSEKPLQPDPEARVRIMAAVAEARRLAEARLRSAPDDRDALFALLMSANVMTDYTAFVERRQLRGLLLARDVLTYARRLIALDPPVYDAYHAMGALEYINSRVPFFVRWFVRFKDIDGSEKKAIEYLQIVVNRGRYYGPFAKVLLAVVHLRARRPAEARVLLEELARQFPQNPLYPRELERIAEMTRTRR